MVSLVRLEVRSQQGADFLEPVRCCGSLRCKFQIVTLCCRYPDPYPASMRRKSRHRVHAIRRVWCSDGGQGTGSHQLGAAERAATQASQILKDQE
jgi:hypothetical protein